MLELDISARGDNNLTLEDLNPEKTYAKLVKTLVPGVGLEPTRPLGQRILSP